MDFSLPFVGGEHQFLFVCFDHLSHIPPGKPADVIFLFIGSFAGKNEHFHSFCLRRKWKPGLISCH